MTTAEDLLHLLPRHVTASDDASGGLVRALLEAVASQLDVLERDIDALYQDWFVETASDWVLPYLADLLGIDELPPGPGRRAVIANMIELRRRKGTPAALEQVARDVTMWPARAVEAHRFLAATAHVNHVRLDRPAVAPLRGPGYAADLGSPLIARGSLDPGMHLAEVRRVARGRGRHNIGNVLVTAFPHQVYGVDRAPARARDGAWWAHPLGLPTPLFALPTIESGIEDLAVEANLPVPLRPRRLLDLLRAARAGLLDPAHLPVEVGVTVASGPGAGHTIVAPERLRVCGLEDLGREPDVVSGDGTVTPGVVLTGRQAMVDPVTGHVRMYVDGVAEPADATGPVAVHLRWAYGATADVGAGTYDRTDLHDSALASDRYQRARPEAFIAQHVARFDTPAPGSGDPAGPDLATVLATVAGEWAGTALPGGNVPTTGSTTVISIPDSGTWTGDVAVTIPAATRLVVVAGTWEPRITADGEVLPPVPGGYGTDGVRPHLRGSLTVTGGPGSSLLVDGLLIEGDLVVTAGDLGALTLCQATVTGALRVNTASVRRNAELLVRVLRCAVGRVRVPATVPDVEVTDSVLTPEVRGAAVASGSVALDAPGANLRLTGVTVRGGVVGRTLTASSCVLDGVTTIAHRQTGCARYTALRSRSKVPRRFRCVPEDDGELGVRAVYVATDPGAPSFLTLASSCPVAIREGGEGGAEMGVHHHLDRPGRLRAAGRLLTDFLPVGLEIGAIDAR